MHAVFVLSVSCQINQIFECLCVCVCVCVCVRGLWWSGFWRHRHTQDVIWLQATPATVLAAQRLSQCFPHIDETMAPRHSLISADIVSACTLSCCFFCLFFVFFAQTKFVSLSLGLHESTKFGCLPATVPNSLLQPNPSWQSLTFI